MGDDRNRILDLLAAGKITAEEAAGLLDALDTSAAQSARTEDSAAGAAGAKTGPKSGWPRFFSTVGAKTSERTGASGTPSSCSSR